MNRDAAEEIIDHLSTIGMDDYYRKTLLNASARIAKLEAELERAKEAWAFPAGVFQDLRDAEAERDRLREGIFRYASGGITFDKLRALCERSSEAAKEATQ